MFFSRGFFTTLLLLNVMSFKKKNNFSTMNVSRFDPERVRVVFVMFVVFVVVVVELKGLLLVYVIF